MEFYIDGSTFSKGDTSASDDLLSTTRAANSAIAKAAAMNRATPDISVLVTGTNLATTSEVTAVTLDQDTYLEINDAKISGFAVQANDADGSLVDAINDVAEETGVTASINILGQLELNAKDGRNIEFSVNGIGGAFAGEADNSTRVEGGKLRVFTARSFSFKNSPSGGNSNDISLGGTNLDQIFDVQITTETAAHSYDISTTRKAIRTLKIIEFAFNDVTEARTKIGAYQNRLSSTIANLQVAHENLSAAQSRIVDADFAQETATLAQNQIVQRAGVSVLSQANQNLSIALSLLT